MHKYNITVVSYLYIAYLISQTLYNFYILLKHACNNGKRGKVKGKRRKRKIL